ncbi:MAG TPA: hypothetical protein ENI51_11755 [Candidatus Atribacteria bacterium]|nr:hypothetical protein [Candidatus Atribacteria bacterium]
MNEDTIREEILKARQSAVSKAGNDWENYVENFLKDSFEQILKTSKDDELKKIIGDIEVQRMGKKSEIEAIKHHFPKLYKTLFIPIMNFAKNRQFLIDNPEIIDTIFDTGFVGDTDVVVFSRKYQIPIVIVSCKVSLHGRLTETLFYSLYYRITNKIKFVLATPDKGKQAKKGRWDTEWGSPKNPSKDRMLSMLFLDGVYVDNVPEFMPEGFNPEKDGTELGGIVRHLSELPIDVLRWYDDIKFNIINNKSR